VSVGATGARTHSAGRPGSSLDGTGSLVATGDVAAVDGGVTAGVPGAVTGGVPGGVTDDDVGVVVGAGAAVQAASSSPIVRRSPGAVRPVRMPV
jgi:hypothetical protein